MIELVIWADEAYVVELTKHGLYPHTRSDQEWGEEYTIGQIGQRVSELLDKYQ